MQGSGYGNLMSGKNHLTRQARASKQVVATESGGRVSHEEISMRSGPIPESSELSNYEKIVPGSAQQIIQMALNEQAHAHKMELEQVQSIKEHHQGVERFDRRGQAMAFGIVLGVMVLAGFMVSTGHAASATTLVSTVLLAYVGAFVFSQRKKRD